MGQPGSWFGAPCRARWHGEEARTCSDWRLCFGMRNKLANGAPRPSGSPPLGDKSPAPRPAPWRCPAWQDLLTLADKTQAIAAALDRAYEGANVLDVDLDEARLVIFSDHHRGARDAADDFRRCERAYCAALGHYLEAGYALLSSEGYRGLKLSAVCAHLSLTTGGFYHWFDSWQTYTDTLLADWSRQRTDALGALAASVSDPVERLETLLATTASLDLAAEAEIRVWSRVDPAVGEVQREVDQRRFGVVLESMRALVGDEDAERFALWGYSVLVGSEQLSESMGRDELFWSLQQVLAAARAHATGLTR